MKIKRTWHVSSLIFNTHHIFSLNYAYTIGFINTRSGGTTVDLLRAIEEIKRK